MSDEQARKQAERAQRANEWFHQQAARRHQKTTLNLKDPKLAERINDGIRRAAGREESSRE
jgi:hypothetical protein